MHGSAATRKAVAAPSAPPPAAAPLAFAAALVANVALAFGAWFVRLADVGPVAAGFWRMALALPVVAGLAMVGAMAGGARPARLGAGLATLLVVGGIAFAGDLGAWHLGIVRTTLANATLFGNVATLMFPVYGFIATRAWPTRVQGLALGLAAAGAALLMGRSFQLDPRRLDGDLLCILAGLLYTVYFIVMARVRAVMAPLSSLALSTAASVLPLLAFALAMGEQVWPHRWGPLLALALASQVLGQGCMIYALGKLSPLVVGLALLIQPVVAASVGWIVYGETLGAPDFVGAALVAAALVLVRRGVAPQMIPQEAA